jgi:hypothetical protein
MALRAKRPCNARSFHRTDMKKNIGDGRSAVTWAWA